MKTHTRLFSAIFAISCAILFTSCSTISERPVLAQVAVQYATIKVLQNNPDRAPRVIEIAQFIRANAGNEQAATVALLEAAVRSQIDFSKLDPADAMLVDILIATVREELVARLGDGVLSPEHVLLVAEVAGWIESAALLSAPRS
jgi:predicted negative regulator of RcsB-dependent stress response